MTEKESKSVETQINLNAPAYGVAGKVEGNQIINNYYLTDPPRNKTKIPSKFPAIEIELNSERGVDYTKLRHLLEQQIWKEADMETAKVMLQAAGKEESDYLFYQELQQFPCADLRTVDRLWRHYSNHRFGYSVQQQIYKEEGEDYVSLSDRIRWRVEGYFVNYKDLTWDKPFIEGYLPRTCSRGVSPIWTPQGFSTLMQRLINCNICN